MSNKAEREYKQDHVIAKSIATIVLVIAVVLNRELDNVYLDVFIVIAWIWSVNSAGYLIETLRGHKHRHDKI